MDEPTGGIGREAAPSGAGAQAEPAPAAGGAYSERAFWNKVGRFAARAGRKVLWNALVLFYCYGDADTPARVKVIIGSALGYFVMPWDAIPDLFPGGFADDLAVLIAVLHSLGTVKSHVKPEHRRQADDTLRRWFGEE